MSAPTPALTIDVVGTPAPQGSKRAFVVNGRAVMAESSKKVKPWRQDVKHAAKDATIPDQGDAFPTRWEPLTGPLRVEIEFFLPRPGYHYGTGRNASKLKPSAPTYVDKKPDVDKLLRSTLDGLKEAGIYRDDAQVAAAVGVKRYADAATGARITITPLASEATSMNVSPADAPSPDRVAGETPTYATRHQPSCKACGWTGAPTYYPDTAATNQRLHDERCGHGQGVLL